MQKPDYSSDPAARNPSAPAGAPQPKPAPKLARKRVEKRVEKPAEKPAGDTPVREIGGRRDGTEPTRFGDWEKNGRCIDF